MPYQRATLKRTTVVSSPKGAVNWVKNYIDETRKHKKENNEIDIGAGKNFFTSRPLGMVTAHGYARDKVATIRKTQGLPNNEAVIQFLHDFCWNQRVKGRKKLGLRMVLSIDPDKVTELCRERVDIDRLIVKVAEQTFTRMAELYYPGDELGYILALHHDAETFKNTTSRHKFIEKHGREPDANDCKPHIHAHVMVLSHTRNDRRINLCDRAPSDRSRGADPLRLDRLSGIREFYQARVQSEIYDFPLSHHQEIEPEWEPVVREAATITLEDFLYREPKMDDRKELRRRVLNRFRWHIRSLNREKLAQQCKVRHAALLEFRQRETAKPTQLRLEAQRDYAAMEKIFRANQVQRTQLVQDLVSRISPSPSPLPGVMVKFWDTPSGKAVILAPDEFRPAKSEDRSEAIRRTILDLEEMRQASRIQSLAELTLLSLKIQALRRDSKDPDWLDYMTKVTRSSVLPNQELLVETTPPGEPPFPTSVISNISAPGLPIPTPAPSKGPEPEVSKPDISGIR